MESLGHIGATPDPNSREYTGQWRLLNIAVQEPFSTGIAGRQITPVLFRTEGARGSNPLTSHTTYPHRATTGTAVYLALEGVTTLQP